MSVAQIIDQLPKLTSSDRRAIERRIYELEDDDMAFMSEAAVRIFQEIDREEVAYAKRKAG
ncbi:MAG: hypothetical protein EBS05_06600 [Proteobacteria bacterium]|nr:hypothetical protein [Pseudomonadota bacterium]